MKTEQMKIVSSTCLDEYGNKGAKPYQCLTMEDSMKGYKRKDNCYTLFVDTGEADKLIKELTAEGNVIVESTNDEGTAMIKVQEKTIHTSHYFSNYFNQLDDSRKIEELVAALFPIFINADKRTGTQLFEEAYKNAVAINNMRAKI
jgi:hypothetical protein